MNDDKMTEIRYRIAKGKYDLLNSGFSFDQIEVCVSQDVFSAITDFIVVYMGRFYGQKSDSNMRFEGMPFRVIPGAPENHIVVGIRG